MSNGIEAYERDCEWLKSRFKSVTEADLEMFCDKIALFMQDGLNEQTARKESLGLLTEKWANVK